MRKIFTTTICTILLFIATTISAFASYEYKTVEAIIPVVVENATETSTVTIEAENAGIPMPTTASQKPDQDGNVTFAISYNEPGEYRYKITQKQTGENVKADNTIYMIRVYITSDESTGELISQVLVFLEQHDEKPELIRFKNTPITAPGEKEKTPQKSNSTTQASQNSNQNTSQDKEVRMKIENMSDVKTGDESHLIMWSVITMIALSATAYQLLTRRMRDE